MLKSQALQESVDYVLGNQEAESFPLAMPLQHFLPAALKSFQLVREEYLKDLDAFFTEQVKRVN